MALARLARMIVLTTVFASVIAVPGGPARAQSSPPSQCAISGPDPAFAPRVNESRGHAQLWRLYQAVFLRQPDEAGLQYWVDRRVKGMSLTEAAYFFTEGREFQNAYGDLGDGAFVDLVYRNILCRAPDSAGRQYWVGRLASGSMRRHTMVINFVELREYLSRTGTCYSLYAGEAEAVSACQKPVLTPLAKATLAADGYQPFTALNGRISGTEIDLTRNLLDTGSQRCSVASINANWMPTSQKDGPDPSVLGVGVIDGVPVRGSSDRTDRGVVGRRADPKPASVVEVWPGQILNDSHTRLNSVLYHDGQMVLESWHASAETSPYLAHLAPEQRVKPSEWVWAAAGIPLIIDGQPDQNFALDYQGDPYTYQTLRHSFLAVDKDRSRAVIGATDRADVLTLLSWARNSGYEDLIKFDGGGSTEYNVAGRTRVAGTSRDIPVWLGIGC